MSGIVSFFAEHPLILVFFADIVVGCWGREKFREPFNMGGQAIIIMTILSIATAMASMRLLAILETGGDISRSALIRLYGAVFTLQILYYIFAKIKKGSVPLAMDVASIIAALGLFNGRLNCIKEGCCQGIYMFGSEVFRWPIRELELMFYVVFALLFIKKIASGKTYGQVYPLFMMLYGIFRFFAEWLREEYTGSIGIIHLAHIWSVISIVVGASFYFELKKKQEKKDRRRKTK